MLKLVKHKLDFIAKRILSLNEVTGLSLPSNYFNISSEMSFESIVSNKNNSDSESEWESDKQSAEEDKVKIKIN